MKKRELIERLDGHKSVIANVLQSIAYIKLRVDEIEIRLRALSAPAPDQGRWTAWDHPSGACEPIRGDLP